MEKKELLEKDLELKISDKNKNQLHQTQRNALKKDITKKICDCLSQNFNVEFVETLDGTYMIIPNSYNDIYSVLEIKLKPLDTDIFQLEDNYKEEMEYKEQKRLEKEQKAKERQAKKENK